MADKYRRATKEDVGVLTDTYWLTVGPGFDEAIVSEGLNGEELAKLLNVAYEAGYAECASNEGN